MTKTTTEGHRMSKELFEEVEGFLGNMINKGPLGWVEAASDLRRKLNPRPNFRVLDVCVDCWKWIETDCPTGANGTCDNFEREKVEKKPEPCFKCIHSSSLHCSRPDVSYVCPGYEAKRVRPK